MQSARNNHVVNAQPHEVKSFGYQIYETKNKLKPAFVDLSGEALRQLPEQIGRENLTDEIRTNLLAYSGDTPAENFDQWNNTQILIHEATFLTRADFTTLETNRNQHSTLEDVLAAVADLSIKALILGHFSSRYSAEEIEQAIRRYCTAFHVTIPVYRLLPGQTHWDILRSDPINQMDSLLGRCSRTDR